MNPKERLKQQIAEIESQMARRDFWQNKEKAVAVQKEYLQLKEKFAKIEKAKDAGEIERILSQGKYDVSPAVLTITSGAGGRDAQDWAAMLLRMYLRFCENQALKTEILWQAFGEAGGPEGRIGLKEAVMEIKNKGSFSVLKNEAGVHRLVRLSPFSGKNLRHTSFAKVEVMPKILSDMPSAIQINPADLKIETFRSSGKGGQNVNKRETAVRLTHLPSGIVTQAQTERYQARNREIALEMLMGKLAMLEEDRQKQQQEKEKGQYRMAEFGNQTRNYVLHPYKLVKDLKTGKETTQAEEVLDGNLNLIR